MWLYSSFVRPEQKAGSEEEQKDWALECCHLHQHLHFACLYLLRDAPTVTSQGLRIAYALPPVFNAALLDRLTSRAVIDVLTGDRPLKCWRRALLELDYSTWAHEPEVAVDFRSRPSRPSSALETAALQEGEEEEGKDDEADTEGNPHQWFFNEYCDAMEGMEATMGDDVTSNAPAMAQLLLEAAVVASVEDMGDWREVCAMWGLWWGPALREAVARAHAHSAADTVLVDLRQSPLVCAAMGRETAHSPCPRLELSSAEWWLTQDGGLSDVETGKAVLTGSVVDWGDEAQQRDDWSRLDRWTRFVAEDATEQMSEDEYREATVEWQRLQRRASRAWQKWSAGDGHWGA